MGLVISSESRQVPKDQDICSSKKYYDILYAYLQCISVRDNVSGIRYFNKSEVNFSKLSGIFNLSRQTVSSKFKNLKELGLIAEWDDSKYLIVELDRDIATLIPYTTLKVMTDALSENCISTYVYLLNRYCANGYRSFQFTIDQIKKYVGLSMSTRSNNEAVVNMLFVLEKIGLIKCSLTTVSNSDNFSNVKSVYQLDWLTNVLKVQDYKVVKN